MLVFGRITSAQARITTTKQLRETLSSAYQNNQETITGNYPQDKNTCDTEEFELHVSSIRRRTKQKRLCMRLRDGAQTKQMKTIKTP